MIKIKIVKPNAVLIDDMPPYQKIERCGRTCYKSEASITEDSALKFVKNMIEHQHTAMLEHAHIYMRVNESVMLLVRKWLETDATAERPNNSVPYLNITAIRHKNYKYSYVSGSFRTFINIFNRYFDNYDENYGMNALYIELSRAYPDIFGSKEPTAKNVDKTSDAVKWKQGVILFDNAQNLIDDVRRMTDTPKSTDTIIAKHVIHSIIFTCDRGVSHEFVRHRPCSFAQESTRYCNYAKDKFGNEITVIKPCFYEEGSNEYEVWKHSCEQSEASYFDLIKNGSTPQQARSVLPNSLKTEIVITATEDEWQHIINLRQIGTTGAPHPQIKEVMSIAYPLLEKASNGRLKN